MKVIITTLTWNSGAKIPRLYPSLIKNLDAIPDLDWHWYIRDNGSKDETVNTIKSWNHPRIHLFEAGHNRHNFAEGQQTLAYVALSGEDSLREPKDCKFADLNVDLTDTHLLLMNDDVEFVDEVSLQKMLDLMNSDEKIGIVGCRLLYHGTNLLQHSGTIFSTKYNGLPYHYRHGVESDADAEKNRYFQAVTGAVSLIRMTDFVKVEGFDLNLIWAFCDVCLNVKIGCTGQKIAYCGGTKIYHEESASLKKNPVNKLFVNHNVAHFKKHYQDKVQMDLEKYQADPNYNVIP